MRSKLVCLGENCLNSDLIPLYTTITSWYSHNSMCFFPMQWYYSIYSSTCMINSWKYALEPGYNIGGHFLVSCAHLIRAGRINYVFFVSRRLPGACPAHFTTWLICISWPAIRLVDSGNYVTSIRNKWASVAQNQVRTRRLVTWSNLHIKFAHAQCWIFQTAARDDGVKLKSQKLNIFNRENNI